MCTQNPLALPDLIIIQSPSHVRLFVTPWTATCQASLSLAISWSLPKFMSTESVMPSNPLILCRSLLLLPSIFPSIRISSNESTLHIRWPKYWSFSFSPSNEYSGLDLGDSLHNPGQAWAHGWFDGGEDALGVGVSLLGVDLLLFLEVGRNVSKEGYSICSSSTKWNCVFLVFISLRTLRCWSQGIKATDILMNLWSCVATWVSQPGKQLWVCIQEAVISMVFQVIREGTNVFWVFKLYGSCRM